MRPIVMIAIGYVALTIFAASFQQAALPELIITSITNGTTEAARARDMNLHFALTRLGAPQLILAASAAGFFVLGWWSP